MKKWIILLCLLMGGITFPITLHAKDAKQALLKVLYTAGHDTLRLNTLRELTKVTKAQPEVRKYYINELLKEAELQNNDTFRCYAYLYHVYVFYNSHNLPGVIQWLEKLEPLARKIGRHDLMFQAQQCAISIQINNEEYEQGEKKTRKMLKEARLLKNIEGIISGHQCMATVYQRTYQWEKAADELEKAYALAKDQDNYQIELEVCTSLAGIYKKLQDNPNWLKYLKLKEQKIKEIIREYPQREGAMQGELFVTYIYYVGYYRRTAQPEMAAKYMQLADEYYSDKYYIYKLLYHKERASHYNYTQERNKAIEELDQILPLLKEVSYIDYCSSLSTKARLLTELGQSKQALLLHQEVLHGKDSLQITVYNKQIEQLKKSYDTSQAALKKASIHQYLQACILILVMIVIGVLTWFAIHYFRLSRRLGKSEKEMKLIAKDVNQANKTKERFLSNMSYAIRVPLKSVVSYSLLLTSEKDISAEEREEASKIISQTSAELMKLINDILDLSRLEAGMMKFKAGNIEMNAYLHDAIAIAAARYKISVTSSLPKNKVCITQTDGSRFLDVMGSLLVPQKADEELSMTLEKVMDENLLRISVTRPLLATSDQTQETIIRNEINRMVIEHFGGEYTVGSDCIWLTLVTTH